MPCGDHYCEYHWTLFRNAKFQARLFEQEVGEVPMFELDPRTLPFSLDAKYIFRCETAGESGYRYDAPPAGPQWCQDPTSQKYRNARQRYVEHPYPMTEFEKIWHIRPMRVYHDDRPVMSASEFGQYPKSRYHYDPALMCPDRAAGFVRNKPLRYVTEWVDHIIDFDLIDGAKRVFPMRIHANDVEGCFTVRHRRPAKDTKARLFLSRLAGISQDGPTCATVTCVDRELIKNFRPHSDLPSVEALTSVRRWGNHRAQFLFNVAAPEDTAGKGDEQSVVNSSNQYANQAKFARAQELDDQGVADSDVESQAQAHRGQNVDSEEDDDQSVVISEDDDDTEADRGQNVDANRLTRYYPPPVWPKLKWDSDSESDTGADAWETFWGECLRQRKKYPAVFEHYQEIMLEDCDWDEDEYVEHEPSAYHNLQIELLFYIASRIPSGSAFETCVNVPMSVRVDFRAALVHAALGDRLPAEIIRMIAAYEPAVIYYCHLKNQSFLHFPLAQSRRTV
ncbi:hypothetical protein HDU86_002960 [Geranomyces michiganensis]|nr:hypothetical protein HDU86_002960 [Geranomyces michiganensis]